MTGRPIALHCLFSLTAACADSSTASAGAVASGDAAILDTAVAGDATAASAERDSAAPALASAGLVGQWYDCSGDLALRPDGTFEWQSAGDPCLVRGGWSVAGATVTFQPTAVGPGCGKPPGWLKSGVGASVAEGVLTLSDLAIFGGGHRLAQGAVQRQRWNLTSAGHTATLDLCLTAKGTFFDGKFASPDCALLACAGVVGQVSQVGSETHVWLQCSGQCPCAGVLVAKTKTAAAMAGSWSMAHCGGGSDGQFEATLGVFPGP
ncbi:MAG: hypothetical protein FJ100_20030 [Deltaproteobacteria bacterium]|nr:hypothetical protein [Deltaproteobacteria bacterium]